MLGHVFLHNYPDPDQVAKLRLPSQFLLDSLFLPLEFHLCKFQLCWWLSRNMRRDASLKKAKCFGECWDTFKRVKYCLLSTKNMQSLENLLLQFEFCLYVQKSRFRFYYFQFLEQVTLVLLRKPIMLLLQDMSHRSQVCKLVRSDHTYFWRKHLMASLPPCMVLRILHNLHEKALKLLL